MKLKKIQLLNFKNHLDSQWKFDENIICFVGDNGSGKTNILDAIHYLSLTKSYFNSSDHVNINFNAKYFTIKGCFEKDMISSNILCGVQEGIPKSIKNNDKKYKRLSDHIGIYPIIFISPTDTNLISESSDIRRRYIDSGISQFNKSYLRSLISYNKTLKQRNKLLKYFFRTNTFDEIALSTYNQSLIGLGNDIYKERKDYLKNLIPVFQEYYYQLSNSQEKVDIEYSSHLNNGDFSDLLSNHLEKDKSSTFTSVGIHKDDLVFKLDDHSIKKHGSQGQQKSFLIALKFAQFDFIKKRSEIKPIILLDDIFDRLDNKRVENLISFIKKDMFSQVFITDTNEERTQKALKKTNKSFTIFNISNNIHEKKEYK